MVLVPPLTQQGPAGAAVLSAGTLGQMPWPQLAQHSWEERGNRWHPWLCPAMPHCWAWGQGYFGGGGMGMDLQARGLLP